jgi:hypothetical protein
MLRIEYKGQPYDWFNLDEMGDIVRTSDFSNTLRENITHYFGVPYERQAVYDEEGLLSSVVDFARALRSVRPWLRVYDVKEMVPELKEKTGQQLEEVHAEVLRSKGLFGQSGSDRGSPTRAASSMADAVRSANESGSFNLSSNIGESSLLANGGGGYNPQGLLPNGPATMGSQGVAIPYPVASTASPRYATPPKLRIGSRIPGVIPSQPTIPGVGPAQVGSMANPGIWPPHAPVSVTPPQAWRTTLPSQPLPTGLSPSTATSTSIRHHSPISSTVGSATMLGGTSAAASNTVAHQSSVSQDDSQIASHGRESVIDVLLSKDPPFERFGFANVPSRDARALLVSWVDPAGLLEVKWNRERPDKRVLEGDRILAVNNRSGEVEEMRAELQNKSVHLRVERRYQDN